MTQPLSELIRLRVTPSQFQQLNEAAALSGLTLSEYLRRLLASAVSLKEELASLRDSAEMLSRSAKSESAIMEILLLLREIASSTQREHAQSSLISSGVTPIKMEVPR